MKNDTPAGVPPPKWYGPIVNLYSWVPLGKVITSSSLESSQGFKEEGMSWCSMDHKHPTRQFLVWILSISQSQQPLWTVASWASLLREGHWVSDRERDAPPAHNAPATNTNILGRRLSCFVTCKDQWHIGGLIFQVCLPFVYVWRRNGLNRLPDGGKCESLKVNLFCTTGHKT